MLKFFIPHRGKGEQIILLLRRHPFIIAVKLAFWLVVATMPPLFMIVLGGEMDVLFNHDLFGPLAILFTSIYYLFVWLFALHTFVDYYLDVWIVTNERIINVEQRGLFSRTVSEQKLYRVQDVTSELKGIFSTLLTFGTVYIQTAGETQRFIFKQVPDPSHIARRVMQLAEENKKLFSTAKRAGVTKFGSFNDAGYKGLYGMPLANIEDKKGIKKGELLDRAGTTELAANLFRITQTDEKIRKDNIKGDDLASRTHFMVGGKVRQTIKDIGGTLPENILPEKHIKELKNEKKKLLKDKKKK